MNGVSKLALPRVKITKYNEGQDNNFRDASFSLGARRFTRSTSVFRSNVQAFFYQKYRHAVDLDIICWVSSLSASCEDCSMLAAPCELIAKML